MQRNGGESITLKSWRLEGFPEAWHLRAIFFHKDLETYILVHGNDFFIVGRQEGRKHALSLRLGADELSKVVTLGPESSQSQTASFLGRTLTLRQWGIEYEPDQQHVSQRLEGSGTDQC